MKRYRLEAEVAVELDVESAFEWYETEEPGLGLEFLEQLRTAYQRILEHPVGYKELRSGIRRALTRQFPYAIYFSIEDDTILILAVFSHRARSGRMAAADLGRPRTFGHADHPRRAAAV